MCLKKTFQSTLFQTKLSIVFMAFWQYFVLKLSMYLLGHMDVLSVDMCFMSKRN